MWLRGVPGEVDGGVIDVDVMSELELRAHLEQETEKALELADEIVRSTIGQPCELLTREQAADYQDARLTMRRLKISLAVKAAD